MSILTRKLDLRPVIYPQFKEAHEKVVLSPWTHMELDIEPDLLDWLERLTETEKRIIGNLFKAFTGAEGIVANQWRKLGNIFGHPEVISMCDAFSHQEAIHAYAYDFLESHLPMSETVTVDWQSDPVAYKKLGSIMSLANIEDLVTSVIAFSAFVEGVSLYSSFATLMSFTKKGYLKTMFQILSWSVRDERLHSNSGIKLAKQLIREKLGTINEEACYEAASLIVKNEIDFIQNAYGETEDLGFVNLDQSLSFVYHRANLKLMQIGLEPIFSNNFAYKPLADFFYTSLEGRGVNDFFALSRNGGGYSSMIKQDFSKCNFGAV